MINLDELKLEDSKALTAKCFHGEPASCSFACPFQLDVRSFLRRASEGKWAGAYKAYRNATVFPVIVSTLCDQPCQNRCQRTLLGDEAIAVRDVEKACVKYVKNRKPQSYSIPPKTEKIAVVGAGVAGLSCAKPGTKKYNVTVFDKEDNLGSLRTHRFPAFAEDIKLTSFPPLVNFQFNPK